MRFAVGLRAAIRELRQYQQGVIGRIFLVDGFVAVCAARFQLNLSWRLLCVPATFPVAVFLAG